MTVWPVNFIRLLTQVEPYLEPETGLCREHLPDAEPASSYMLALLGIPHHQAAAYTLKKPYPQGPCLRGPCTTHREKRNGEPLDLNWAPVQVLIVNLPKAVGLHPSRVVLDKGTPTKTAKSTLLSLLSGSPKRYQ